jgi:signal transduction histidine kinase
MTSRLFLKIYLTLLGSVALLAVTGIATVVWLVGFGNDRNLYTERAAVLAAALPEDADSVTLQSTLDRLGMATGAELTVRDADGLALASYQPSTPPAPGFDPITVALSEGRTLVVRLQPPFGPPRGNPLILLLVVSSLTALLAWPVVHHLTKRLELLRRNVEAWGTGDLSARAPVQGGDEIAVVAKTFNYAAARVEALIASNHTLLANASHELRSPLARLRLVMDLYEHDPSVERREEIYRNLDELDTLVGEILLSSRLSHTDITEPSERIDLLALVAEEAARSGLEVSGTSMEVLGDRRLLHQLVRNLVQNAMRHGRLPVEISVSHVKGRAQLAVCDHGPGIPANDVSKVFEPFYRPGGYGEAAGGWGLGLTLVRQIAERHGGTVRVDTRPGKGALFVVSLPMAEKDVDKHDGA